jgi:hypothetical protein
MLVEQSVYLCLIFPLYDIYLIIERIDMKVENGIQTYKTVLELQKQLVDMLIQQNLQINNQNETHPQQNENQKNVVEGKKVSIYV